jgi:SAM-dependent methyltransferase
MNKINSKEYWETRFKEDWEINKGREQTKFFAKLMVDNLPKTLKSIIKKEKLSIMDWGCGEGDSLEIIHKEFAESKLIGLDISKNAIIKAKEYHPSFEFTTKTLSELNKQQDIIFSSNCLEHFNNPNTILNKLTEFSKDYLILVLPFQEYKKHIEHLVTFDYDSIKVTANDMFLIYHKEIDASELNQTFWEGKQILLIYARSESKGVRDLDIKIEDTIQSIKLDIISKNDEKINNITTAKDKVI